MIAYSEQEEVACPLCSSEKKTTVCGHFHPYLVVRCRSCRLIYLSPRLPEAAMLQRYARSSYFSDEAVGYSDYRLQEASLRATFRKLLCNLHKRKLTGGALLEIGCGYGYLLEEAAGYFTTRMGTEFSPAAAAHARRKADAVFEGGIDQVPRSGKFDCIIAVQVVEHVYHPRAFLEAVRARLHPGGKIILATPDAGSPWRQVMGRHWPSYKIPEHILYFDKRSLTSLLRQSGFSQIASLPYPHAFSLKLAASKLHIALPQRFDARSIWIPATTFALYGVAPQGESHG